MGGMIAIAALSTAKYLYDQYQAGKKLTEQEQRFLQAVNELDVNNPEAWYAKYKQYADPILYETYQLQDTSYNDINVDPTTLSAQQKALDELINLSEEKGLNAIDQQALNEIVNAENRNLQGQNQALLQEAMQRGIYGSGLELAQRLQNAQSSANRMNSQDMNIMSQAQQRALDALSSYGNLASSMRGQDYSEQAQRAAAQDAINQANWQNKQSVSNANVDWRNKTNMANVDIANQEETQRAQTERDLYGTKVDKAKLISDFTGKQMDTDTKKKESDDKTTGTMFQTGAAYFGGK